MKFYRLAAAFLAVLPGSAQVAILQIRVVDGDGGVHVAGSRTLRPLTVQITDETGAPVQGATVTFHLPEDGPSGVFSGGLRTEVVLTDASGRAGSSSVQWNSTAGRLSIRILASRDQAHAGILSDQYIGPLGGKSPPRTAAVKRGRSKWVLLLTIIAVGATAGVVNGSRSGAAQEKPAQPQATLSIGSPSITLGHP